MSSAQDAGDSPRLLEAPSPLVLMVVVVPSWWWRQRRKTSVALGAVLARLILPGAFARLILPVVLTRPATPLRARATVVLASSAASSSLAVAPVVPLGASTKASISNGPELLTVVGVVAVNVVEGVEQPTALG